MIIWKYSLGNISVGVFTFQVQLHSDGVIKFVYKDVSRNIHKILISGRSTFLSNIPVVFQLEL